MIFRLIRCGSVYDFNIEIGEMLTEGWELRGDVVYVDGGYCQALIKETEKDFI